MYRTIIEAADRAFRVGFWFIPACPGWTKGAPEDCFEAQGAEVDIEMLADCESNADVDWDSLDSDTQAAIERACIEYATAHPRHY